jgi:AcrR family transcriptional regulator
VRTTALERVGVDQRAVAATAHEERPGVGRPRDADIDTAVLNAARELLAEIGYERVTMDATAARAGTSKAAIYRRFASKAEMLFTAVLHGADIDPPADTGSLYGDLLALATEIRAQLSSPHARAVASSIIAEINRSPDVAGQVRGTFTTAERAVIAAILDRAAARREIAGERSAETVHRLIGGGLIATALAFGEQPDDDALASMVAVVAGGLANPHRSSPTTRPNRADKSGARRGRK